MKISVVDNPPRTLMEVFKMLPEGTLAELIDNQLHMSPSPKSKHQIILNEINFKLLTHFKENKTGMVYIAPFDVYLDQEKNVVQPDLIVILNQNMHILREDSYIFGVPNMLIEILSPDNRNHDLVLKKGLYERFEVQEYWIIDPDTRLSIGFQLQNSKYKPVAEDIGVIKSELLKASFTF